MPKSFYINVCFFTTQRKFLLERQQRFAYIASTPTSLAATNCPLNKFQFSNKHGVQNIETLKHISDSGGSAAVNSDVPELGTARLGDERESGVSNIRSRRYRSDLAAGREPLRRSCGLFASIATLQDTVGIGWTFVASELCDVVIVAAALLEVYGFSRGKRVYEQLESRWSSWTFAIPEESPVWCDLLGRNRIFNVGGFMEGEWVQCAKAVTDARAAIKALRAGRIPWLAIKLRTMFGEVTLMAQSILDSDGQQRLEGLHRITCVQVSHNLPTSVKKAECRLGLEGTEAEAEVRKARFTLVHFEGRGGRDGGGLPPSSRDRCLRSTGWQGSDSE
ncbi:hypothetical protein EVAR_96212_1 [Eumeta japonica]|uniref:Uncharacterized protein n=1 Tax=Eumeta variegata TaxID=151549 RepID=A0A4C1WJJ3_EUMVA|nr:hypothetical protein EVAR_96212_1 [Eumeta japonica]